jgi:hypothetical protein
VEGESSVGVSAESDGLFSSLSLMKTALGLAVFFTGIYFLLATGMSSFNRWRQQNVQPGEAMIEKFTDSPDAETESKPAEIAKPAAAANGSTTSRTDTPQTGVAPTDVSVGQQVQARWDGRWIKATVLEKVRGGIMLRVRLDDPKFPHPVVVAGDQVRAQ